jgi:hypothetical protein
VRPTNESDVFSDGFGAVLLVYVNVFHVPQIFQTDYITQKIVPDSVAQEIASARLAERQSVIRELDHTVLQIKAVVFEPPVLQYHIRRGRFSYDPPSHMDYPFTFQSDDTIGTIYTRAALELGKDPSCLLLYRVGPTLVPLIDRSVKWYNVDESHLCNPQFFAIPLAARELDAWNANRVLVFIAGYITREMPPLQFFYWQLIPPGETFASLVPRFKQYCRMPTYISLCIYIADANDAIKHVGLEETMQNLVDGTILVIHPDEPYAWNYVPQAIIVEDDDESETDDSEDETDEPVRRYRPGENPVSFEKYLMLTKNVMSIHIESLSLPLPTRFKVPRRLAINKFYGFVGKCLDPSFRVETHVILFYYMDDKHPFEFKGNRIGLCLNGPSSQLRFTIFMFANIDRMCLVELTRLRISVDGQKLHLIVPSETTISELAERCSAACSMGEPVRVVALRDQIVDGIYRPDTPVGHAGVRNPLALDRIPVDQQVLGPMDKLLRVSYVRHRQDVKPDLEPIDTGYLKINPDEPFEEARARLKEFGQVSTSFGLENDHHTVPIFGETVLWDVIDDLSVLKVTFHQNANHERALQKRRG